MSAERLLLVEDDETTREVLALLLGADGWQVEAVGSGEAALAVLHSQASFLAVLCDLHLPGVQGPALAGAVRPLLHGGILIAMSASVAGAEAEGYDAVLSKPFGPAEVRAALRSAMAGRGAARSAEGGAADVVPEPPGDDLSVIATEVFLKLEQQMGVRAKELYAFALADAGDRLRRMEASAAAGDLVAYRAEAHAVKGSAGMIGARRLQALAGAAELEGADPAGRPAEPCGGSAAYAAVREPLAIRTQKVQQMRLACDEIRLMLETLFPI